MSETREEKLRRLTEKVARRKTAQKWHVAENEALDVQRAVQAARTVVLGEEEHQARAIPLDDDALLAYAYRTNPPSAEELYRFAVDVLGYTRIRPQPHDEMCDFLISLVPNPKFDGKERQYAMLLVPRGTFKTTLGVVAFVLYLLVKNPNMTILLGGYRHDLTQERLGAIKEQIRRPRFRTLFGDWRPAFREETWNENSIVITARDAGHSVQVDPTIDTCGVDRPKEGGHFNLIILDDIHNESNVQTPVMRQKVYQFVGRCIPLLNPGGSMLVIGTRWAHNDAYGRIMRDDRRNVAEGHAPLYRVLVRGAKAPDGSLYFPEELTENELARIRRTPGMTEYLFRSQYFNETVEDAEHYFPAIDDSLKRIEFYVDPWSRNAIVRWEGRNIPVLTTIAWDTAGHKPTAETDYHGVTVVGCDPVANWWVLEGLSIKDTPNNVVREVARLLMFYRPHTLSVEVVAQSGVWIVLLRNYSMQNALYMPYIVENRPPNNLNKLSRIDTTLQPLAEAKRLLISDACVDLVNQMQDYPQVDHYDVMDSLAQHRTIVRPADPTDGLDYFDYETDEYDRKQSGRVVDFRRRLGAYAGRSGTPRPNVALRALK